MSLLVCCVYKGVFGRGMKMLEVTQVGLCAASGIQLLTRVSQIPSLRYTGPCGRRPQSEAGL
jgi:hypothetical protein